MLVISSLCVLILSSCKNSPVVDANPWPMFHHDLQHTGLSSYDTSENNGTLKWRYETGDDIYSSPSISSDGTIYIVSLDCYIYAIGH